MTQRIACWCACLLASWTLLPAGLVRGAGLEPELNKAYQLEVVVHMSRHRLLTEVFRERVERELSDGLQAAFGDLVRVKVVRQHPLLPDVLEKGLQKSLDAWKERSETKTHFVLIEFSGVHYEIQARQHDGPTGTATRVVRQERTRDRDFVAKAAALLVERDFGWMGAIQPGGKPGQLKVELKAGKIGESLGRWIKAGDIFELIQVPAGDREPRRVPYHILQVVEAPRAASDGGCVCKLFQDREAPLPSSAGIVGYRCLKLGALRAPLRLRVTRPTSALVLPLQVRRQGFQGEEAVLLRGQTDETGVFDTLKLGEPGIFEQLALVTIDISDRQSIRVPVPLIDQQYVVIPIAASGGEGEVSRFRLEGWLREISDSILVQNNLFKELKGLTTDPKQRTAALDKARAGMERSRRDHQRLTIEREQLKKEFASLIDANRNAFNQADDRLRKIKQGESELESFVIQLEKIDREEKSPERQKWLAEIERAKLLERDAEYGKAIAIYQKVLEEGYQSEKLKKDIADLKKAWETDDEDLQLARGFIYNVWPGLENTGLKERLPDVKNAFAVCKKKRDLLGPKRLLDATVAHGIRMEKELSELKPTINVDDEKPSELIKELSGELGKLTSDIDVYLKSASGGR